MKVSAQITDGLPVMPDDARYLEAEIAAEPPAIAAGASFAEAAGMLNIAQGKPTTSGSWGVVYDLDGQVLGAAPLGGRVPLSTSSSIPFTF